MNFKLTNRSSGEYVLFVQNGYQPEEKREIILNFMGRGSMVFTNIECFLEQEFISMIVERRRKLRGG